jgi:hypothetical protein
MGAGVRVGIAVGVADGRGSGVSVGDAGTAVGVSDGKGSGVWVRDGVGVPVPGGGCALPGGPRAVGNARVAVGSGVKVGAAATSVAVGGGLGWGKGAKAQNPIDNKTSSAMPAKASMQDSTASNRTRVSPTLDGRGILKCIATPCLTGAFNSKYVLRRLWCDF